MTGKNEEPLNLKKLDPQYVLDHLMQCFTDANKEMSKALGQNLSDEEIQARAKVFLGDAFRNCKVDLKNPTKDGILKAMDQCKNNIMGSLGEEKGNEFVQKYYVEMKSIVDRMDEDKKKD